MSKQNQVINIYGKKGYGKSTLIERLIQPLDNVLWFDVFGAFHPAVMEGNFRSRFPGFIRIDKKIEETCARIRGSIFDTTPFRITHIAGKARYREMELEEIFKALQDRYKRLKQKATIVLDETQVFKKGPAFVAPVVSDIASMGRHYTLDQIYAVRRPAEMPRDASANADHIYMFQIKEPLDLTYLSKVVPREYAKEIPKLKKFDYIHYDVAQDKAFFYES